MPIPPVRFYETMVELVHLGVRAHTDGDVFAHLRDEHVVFAGDPMWSDYRPNIEGADIQGHIKALKQILRMKPGVIVPGYGPVAKNRESPTLH